MTIFETGQSVWDPISGRRFQIVALYRGKAWLRSRDAESEDLVWPITSISPNAPIAATQEEPQKCPYCGSKAAFHWVSEKNGCVSCQPNMKIGTDFCGLRGPYKSNAPDAIAAWNKIRIQHPQGDVRHNCATQAIEEIYSIFEHCVKLGMKRQAISAPQTPDGREEQICRFLDKQNQRYQACREQADKLIEVFR